MATVDTTKDDVKATHREYKANSHRWDLVNNVIDGNVDGYLPDVGSLETDDEKGKKRQKEYVNAAYFPNFTANTLAEFVGGVFRKAPNIKFPTELDYLTVDADGEQVSIVQQAQMALNYILANGRAGLFTDMPAMPEDKSVEDDESWFNPKITLYPASSIINWGTANNPLVVLLESYSYDNPDNEFVPLVGSQYRILDLFDGKYRQRLRMFDEAGVFINEVDGYPLANGKCLTEIPFSFIGAKNNDSTVDPSPLFALADINRALYINIADNEDMLHLIAQVMLAIYPHENMEARTWNEMNPNGVNVGCRDGLVVPGGRAELLQAKGDGALRQAITDKFEQASYIGGKIISKTQTITAESARLQRGSETSILANAADNVSDAYFKQIKFCQMFKGMDSDFEFELNTSFFLEDLQAADVKVYMDGVIGGILPKSILYDALRKSGRIDESVTNEELDAAVKDVQPIV